MKIDDIISDKSVLEREKNISREELTNMSMEELLTLIFLIHIFGDIFLNEEIENATESKDKMKLSYESTGCICIDTSKMEYV